MAIFCGPGPSNKLECPGFFLHYLSVQPKNLGFHQTLSGRKYNGLYMSHQLFQNNKKTNSSSSHGYVIDRKRVAHI
jgi:hypothetical protein